MQQLIQALLIFLKYGNPDYPTHCEHDQLFVMIDPELVSPEDITTLSTLGFEPSDNTFVSSKFGSA